MTDGIPNQYICHICAGMKLPRRKVDGKQSPQASFCDLGWSLGERTGEWLRIFGAPKKGGISGTWSADWWFFATAKRNLKVIEDRHIFRENGDMGRGSGQIALVESTFAGLRSVILCRWNIRRNSHFYVGQTPHSFYCIFMKSKLLGLTSTLDCT